MRGAVDPNGDPVFEGHSVAPKAVTGRLSNREGREG